MDQRIFLETLRSAGRPGMENLVRFIEGTDFFRAPASTKYHAAYVGGLADHSWNVYQALCRTVPPDANRSSMIICGLLHDICKADFYKQTTRNVKNEETGQWEKVPCYTIEDSLPLGHGEKSVIILQRFIPLTEEESVAIRWHMGGYDDAAKGGYSSSVALSAAFRKYPLAVMLHIADMMASYLMDDKEDKNDH